ncbi:hypothetical protein [Flavobacterium sp. 7A]|nr:hypothetical protein [Flavobacterium sp. 7A]MCW2121192.1 hypothetical protein [Flavobacterium sp. 7A]
MMTPLKGFKYEFQKNRDKAADDLLSVVVSRIRQPIEPPFIG